jgi:hypothetical protein
MSYKKFKPELTDNQVDDLEKATEDTKSISHSEQTDEELKVEGKPLIKILLIDGTNKEIRCDLSTKVKDVARILFDKEISEGKYIKLLFAGKVLDYEKSLEESNVQNNYWLHAIIKNANNNENAPPIRDNQQQNGDNSKNRFDKVKIIFSVYYLSKFIV